MAATFSDLDKARVRYHLEYPNTASVVTVIGGTVRTADTQYVLEAMLNNIVPEAAAMLTRVLDILDGIEQQMVDANTRLQASKADVVTLNPEEHSKLEGTYLYWQGRLSKQLDVPVNPQAPRSGLRGLNVKRH